MEQTIKAAYIKKGVKGVIRWGFQKLAGIDQVEEKINTLNYFLNHYCDISSFPKATGDLALIQKGDTLLLAITDAICRKHGLEFWLNAGTCLGAVRHQGFIPWDDDMDICMIRETYEKAVPILQEELSKFGIDAVEQKNEPISRIGIGYRHHETGLWIDLLPAEYTTIDPADGKKVDSYHKRCNQYKEKWRVKKEKLNRLQMFEFRKKYIPEICSKEDAKSIIYCPEFGLKPRLWRVEDIFPLEPIVFEGYEMLSPHDAHSYLIQFYGSNYLGFPQSGLEHHGGSRGKLTTWAKQSNVDMNAIISELEEILARVSL